MFYVTSSLSNKWYPVKAKTLDGAKRAATNMFSYDKTLTIKVGKMVVGGVNCVAMKSCKGKWSNL